MNSEKKRTATNDGGADTAASAISSVNEATSSAIVPNSADSSGSNGRTTSHRRTSENRRSAVRSLIQRYFYQLKSGCGNQNCKNINCASSGKLPQMSANDMAAKAIQLFTQDAPLCDPPVNEGCAQSPSSASKVPRTDNIPPLQESPTTSSSTSLPSQQDIDMISPNESSCSSVSTITTTSTSSSQSSVSPNEALASDIYRSTPSLKLISFGSVLEPKDSVPLKTDDDIPTVLQVETISEKMIEELIVEGEKKYESYKRLKLVVNDIFSNVERLSKNFCRSPTILRKDSTSHIKIQELLKKSHASLKKEDLRTLEGENDKDNDSTQDDDETSNVAAHVGSLLTNLREYESMDAEEKACTSSSIKAGNLIDNIDPNSSDTDVDFKTLRQIKKLIFTLANSDVIVAVNASVERLTDSMKLIRHYDWEKVIHCLVVCFDIVNSSSNTPADFEYVESSLPKLCHVTASLPINAQARLARIWAVHCSDQLQTLIHCCQQIITLQVILDEENLRENVDIIAVTKVLKIIFYANLLAGQLETPSSVLHDNCTSRLPKISQDGASTSSGASAIDQEDLFNYTGMSRPHMPKFAEDKLEQALQVSVMDSRVPFVPFEEFYNEPLSDAIQMHQDYLSYKSLALESDSPNDSPSFTFMLYSFILTPATKVIALYYDSRMRMYSERNSTLYSILNSFGDNNDISVRPDLRLTVRRDSLIDDALVGLELIAMSNPKDLKKQLVVEFTGEQGIDEGGVSKEFFQLIVEEIFNPDFGMFVQQEETNTVWFNTTPFENGAQFTLIGIILGLAIYNNVILAVNFPMVVYRKLMGCRGTFNDLKDWNPTLYRSLKALLDYEEPDLEEVFMQTFKISYNDIFGEMVEYELLPNGGDVPVGQHNKRQFVDMYSDYLLNESIEEQFKAFKKGFEMVTDESPLKLLFRPEEIELLVCGSRKFDFIELEKSTEYEGGYSAETQIIKDFWSIVHSMPDESKRKLLEFTTGSDRIPVGGLSRLRLLITRHGPDTDRLPTSHTCFNVLLLPEYSSKEKLEERLLKAINYSKGFGML